MEVESQTGPSQPQEVVGEEEFQQFQVHLDEATWAAYSALKHVKRIAAAEGVHYRVSFAGHPDIKIRESAPLSIT